MVQMGKLRVEREWEPCKALVWELPGGCSFLHSPQLSQPVSPTEQLKTPSQDLEEGDGHLVGT